MACSSSGNKGSQGKQGPPVRFPAARLASRGLITKQPERIPGSQWTQQADASKEPRNRAWERQHACPVLMKKSLGKWTTPLNWMAGKNNAILLLIEKNRQWGQ